MQVNIYIETENQIMRRQLHRYGYVISTMHKGQEVTVSGFGETDDTCKGTLVTAIAAAVQRLRGSCELHIHVRDGWIAQMVRSLQEWAGKDFKRGSGEPVTHAETWAEIFARMQALQIEQVETETGRHEYSSWIQSEIKRRIMESQNAAGLA